jgi:hypothetical protein
MADSKEEKDNWKPEDNSDAESQGEEEDVAPKRKQPPGNVVRPNRISIVIKTPLTMNKAIFEFY